MTEVGKTKQNTLITTNRTEKKEREGKKKSEKVTQNI